jgi:thiol-disulfide isomerase/thioredoxin
MQRLLASLVVLVAAVVHAGPPALPADWALTKEFPAITDPDGGPTCPPERLTLGVEQGWLVVRLQAADGGLQWHVVLARADNSTPPTVVVDPSFRTIEVQYGPYFVREHFGRLRVYREKKTASSPTWPAPQSVSSETARGNAGNLRLSKAGDWFWLVGGAVSDKPDVRIRFQHAQLGDNGYGFQGFRGGLAYVFCGDEAKCFDEGDLLTGFRVTPCDAVAVLRSRKLKAEFGAKPAPELDGTTWFNAKSPISLEQLRGKVVLLDFWGMWCGPCVAKLPATQALHEKFKDKGLVVIGVHSAHSYEGLEGFLKDRKFTFPVMRDSAKTASRYLIAAWPTYFLIDKSGKVVLGFTHETPSTESIEQLLAEKPK